LYPKFLYKIFSLQIYFIFTLKVSYGSWFHIQQFSCQNFPSLVFSPLAQQSLEGQGPLIIEASRSHSIRHNTHSVGLLWTSCQSGLEICTWQHTTLTSDRFEPAIPASQQPHSHTLDCAANAISTTVVTLCKIRFDLQEFYCLPTKCIPCVYFGSFVQKQPICFYNTNEMCLLCGLYLKYNSGQFYQTFELRILPVIVARSMPIIVSPCTRKYETQNAVRVASVLYHLNYLKIESVAQLCDVSHKMTISASGTYLFWRNVFHLKYVCKLRTSRRLCKTLTQVFFTKIFEIPDILEIYRTTPRQKHHIKRK